ncbi:hypothetical protein ABKN59_010836 [Abortiporus biennis]
MPRQTFLIHTCEQENPNYVGRGQIVFCLRPSIRSRSNIGVELIVWQVHNLAYSSTEIRWHPLLVIGTISPSNDSSRVQVDQWRIVESDRSITFKVHNESSKIQTFVLSTPWVPDDSHEARPNPFCLLHNIPPKSEVVVDYRLQAEAYFVNGQDVQRRMRIGEMTTTVPRVLTSSEKAWNANLFDQHPYTLFVVHKLRNDTVAMIRYRNRHDCPVVVQQYAHHTAEDLPAYDHTTSPTTPANYHPPSYEDSQYAASFQDRSSGSGINVFTSKIQQFIGTVADTVVSLCRNGYRQAALSNSHLAYASPASLRGQMVFVITSVLSDASEIEPLVFVVHKLQSASKLEIPWTKYLAVGNPEPMPNHVPGNRTQYRMGDHIVVNETDYAVRKRDGTWKHQGALEKGDIIESIKVIDEQKYGSVCIGMAHGVMEQHQSLVKPFAIYDNFRRDSTRIKCTVEIRAFSDRRSVAQGVKLSEVRQDLSPILDSSDRPWNLKLMEANSHYMRFNYSLRSSGRITIQQNQQTPPPAYSSTFGDAPQALFMNNAMSEVPPESLKYNKYKLYPELDGYNMNMQHGLSTGYPWYSYTGKAIKFATYLCGLMGVVLSYELLRYIVANHTIPELLRYLSAMT